MSLKDDAAELFSDEELYRQILARDVLFIEEERITVRVTPMEGTGTTHVEVLVDGKDLEGVHRERMSAHAREFGGVELAKA